MKQELDEYLCKVYPKMMVNRNKGMQETCMCWGFECGDGWFNILNQLMGDIQSHIDWRFQQIESAKKYNEMAAQCKSGNFDLFEQDMSSVIDQEYKEKRLQEIVNGDFRTIPKEIAQVTLDQVKEKFGTLRFYYTGGDDVIDGMVRMAESMSGVMCEGCGSPATTEGPEDGFGWIRTECKTCAEARELARKQAAEEREQRKLLKEGFEE
jgi:methanogenic corrinoid protein MtbC1